MKYAKALVRRLLPARIESWLTRIVRAVEIAARVFHLRLVNRLSRRRIRDAPDSPVVSLTSFPARLETVYLTIESIFRQSEPPGGVYLWLYEGEVARSELPSTLRRLERRGLHIEFVPENLRGAKKLIYAARAFPERSIVTADDDLIYPRDWLQQLMAASRATPGAVVCHRGHKIRRRPDGPFHRYWDCMRTDRGGVEPAFALLPTGNGGVLYPPGALNSRVFDTELMHHLCPTADDIWFKAMTLLNQVPSRRVNTRNFMPIVIPGSQEQALIHGNKHANDAQLQATFSHFGLEEYFPKESLDDA
ncbi:glycosyltransferase [Thioalkalivibrio sp. ALE28]|uniref:glycosyltransferase n=1 Tax=Thioalkalivibrio sp. ALE28 TaxID=1158179 RepID=UPI000381009E|nr:glycosyltransferase [Thioalkalivibrio sp. ALE28]